MTPKKKRNLKKFNRNVQRSSSSSSESSYSSSSEDNKKQSRPRNKIPNYDLEDDFNIHKISPIINNFSGQKSKGSIVNFSNQNQRASFQKINLSSSFAPSNTLRASEQNIQLQIPGEILNLDVQQIDKQLLQQKEQNIFASPPNIGSQKLIKSNLNITNQRNIIPFSQNTPINQVYPQSQNAISSFGRINLNLSTSANVGKVEKLGNDSRLSKFQTNNLLNKCQDDTSILQAGRIKKKSLSQNIFNIDTSKKKQHLCFCHQITHLWSRSIRFIRHQYFFSNLIQSLSNQQGIRSIYYFQLLTTFFNFYLFCTAIFLYSIAKQIVNIYNQALIGQYNIYLNLQQINTIFQKCIFWYYHLELQPLYTLFLKLPDFIINKQKNYGDLIKTYGIQIFQLHYINSADINFVYFGFVYLGISIVLVIMSYYKYVSLCKCELMDQMEVSRGLQCFNLIFSEYNWKQKYISTRKMFQVSLRKKIGILNQQRKQTTKENNLRKLLQLLMQLCLWPLLITLVIGGWVFCIALNNGVLISRNLVSSPMIMELLISLLLVIIAEIFSSLSSFLSIILRRKRKNDHIIGQSHIIRFGVNILIYSFYIFMKSAIIYKDSNKNFILGMFNQEYIQFGYMCPQQSIAYSLGSVYLIHAFLVIIMQNFFAILQKVNSGEFKVVSSSSPIIVSNMIILMNMPYNLIIFPIGIFVIILSLLQQVVLSRRLLPDSERISSAHTQLILAKMFVISILLSFIHLFFISTISSNIFHFNDNPSHLCGPFTESFTNIFASTYAFFSQLPQVGVVLDILFWTPLLICMIVILTFKAIASQMHEKYYTSLLYQRDHEKRQLHKHYKKRIARIQNKIQNQLSSSLQITNLIDNKYSLILDNPTRSYHQLNTENNETVSFLKLDI